LLSLQDEVMHRSNVHRVAFHSILFNVTKLWRSRFASLKLVPARVGINAHDKKSGRREGARFEIVDAAR
jgi:hypothetical protein